MNIAVCDDEENIRIYIKKLIGMQDADCQIIEFSSGGELLRFWEQEDREQIEPQGEIRPQQKKVD